MADEQAGKLFQDPGIRRFEDAQLRLVVSTKIFKYSLEPLVSRKRFELAQNLGEEGLQELKRSLTFELARVEAALKEPPPAQEVSPFADQVTLMVTLARQERGQAGYAYFAHKHTVAIRKEREERAKCQDLEPILDTDSESPEISDYPNENQNVLFSDGSPDCPY